MKTKIIYTSSSTITSTYPPQNKHAALFLVQVTCTYRKTKSSAYVDTTRKSVPTAREYSDVFESDNSQTRDRIIVEAQNVES